MNKILNLALWRVLVLIQVGSATPRRDKHTPKTKEKRNGKTNKILKNLPTNRDISTDIENFAAEVTARPGTKIAVYNEYHFVN